MSHAACIGWPAEGGCSEHGIMHGCRHPDGHHGDHVCLCGARAKGERRRIRRTHWRGRGLAI